MLKRKLFDSQVSWPRNALVAATAFMVFGVGSAANADGHGLKTAVDGTFAPHAFPKLSGGIQGFNVDLFAAVAEQLGKEIDITATQWSGILPGLQAGTYDFVAAPTTVTEERTQNLLFTEGYLNTDFQFVVKKGSESPSSLEEFKGKIISVNKGSAYDKWARSLEEDIGWEVQSFGTQSDSIQAVLSGRADANVAGNTVVAWAVKENDQLELSYLHSTGKVFASPTRKDTPEIRMMLEGAIECLKTNGTIAELHEKWFGYAPAEGSAAVTVFPGYGVPGMEGYDETEHTPDCK